nr:unnamed protein product [Spirometra erinaceieuropaei]
MITPSSNVLFEDKTWRFTATPSSLSKSKPVTSATIPAPGFASQLRVVRTHRVNFGALGNNFIETEIDAVSVRRSASCEARAQAMVGIFDSTKPLQPTGETTGTRSSRNNDSNHLGSPALVSKRLAQIPLVPTRILRPSRGHDATLSDIAGLLIPSQGLPNPPPTTANPFQCPTSNTDAVDAFSTPPVMGDGTLARRCHVTDHSLPSSSSLDAFICSPPVVLHDSNALFPDFSPVSCFQCGRIYYAVSDTTLQSLLIYLLAVSFLLCDL